MTAVETEVKFRVHDLPRLEEQLASAGFQQVTPRTFEHNVLFDTPDRSLRARQSILRVRRYGNRWVVTHKELPPNGNPATERHKHRIETETEVQDGEAIAAIFASIGYKPAFTYEKWRTEYADSNGHCVIDETPIGLFAELEGPSEWIDRTADLLGLSRDDLMTLSYGRLFDEWCAQTGSSAQNLTFEEIPSDARTARV
jgi:adenylate cyclase, class 2